LQSKSKADNLQIYQSQDVLLDLELIMTVAFFLAEQMAILATDESKTLRV
jgi:hypothetical protein